MSTQAIKKKTQMKANRLHLSMRCPVCTKRAFDISDLPKQPIHVEIKCPHCHNIVRIPCTAEAAIG